MSRENTPANPVIVVIIIVSIMLIGGLVRNAISLRQARQRLEITKNQVSALETRKINIEKQAAAETDESALDQTIRNKLNLAKPGETIVIITGTDSSGLVPIQPKNNNLPEPPITQWWNLLNPKS
jgi:cell division protein FtsB